MVLSASSRVLCGLADRHMYILGCERPSGLQDSISTPHLLGAQRKPHLVMVLVDASFLLPS